MFIDQVSSAGAMPALEAMLRFSGQRQRLIASNIANFETPNYQPADVSPGLFQRQLQRALDERREANGGGHGALSVRPTREVSMSGDGTLRLSPLTPSENVLFHDRNNRDLERTMQKLVENSAMFRVATDLLKSRRGILTSAMQETV
ncbi:MAG: flagellar basal body rod protein FlgB [Planctomycetota bacterium]